MRFIYFTFVFQMDEVMTRKDFEVMAPVGSYESLYAALQGGADSVYFGVEGLNMRARSSANFTLEDLKNIVSVCSEKGVKTYLTVNTVIYNQELEKMRQVIDCAGEAGVTAIIASDLAAILYARSVGVEVHISTQCNVTNFEVVRFFAQYADVIVLAREVVLEQVMEIHRRIVGEDLRGPNGGLIKIEMFAHGALCMAVSGKCYLSLHEKNASANRGACNQICRRAYTVKDRENEVELDIENEYIMSPKDLCTIGFINKMIDAGVRVFKIEGRARSAEYVRTVCECYNEAINAYLDDTYSADKIRIWKKRLATVFNRGFWNGYYLGQRLGEWSEVYGSKATKKKILLGKVTNYFTNLQVAEFKLESFDLKVGDEILIQGPTTGTIQMKVPEIRVDLQPVEKVEKGILFSVQVPGKIRRGDKLYKWVYDDEKKQSNEMIDVQDRATIDIVRGHEVKIGSLYKIIKVNGNENNLLKNIYKVKIEQRTKISKSIPEENWKEFDEIIPNDIIANIDEITGSDNSKLKKDEVLRQLRKKKYAEYTEEIEISETYERKDRGYQMFDKDGNQMITIIPYYINSITALPEEYYKITYNDKTVYYNVKD